MPSPYRLLVTGMSGTGKSTVVAEFRARGIAAIDMDDAGWSHHDRSGHQQWNADRLAEALDVAGTAPLVVSGCAETQVLFYPRFTHIVLLTVPPAVMRERLGTRAGNDFGKRPGELDRILADQATHEPGLRRRASLVLDTDQPLASVMTRILAHVG
jgi:dephospho-CoA kinase